MITATVSPPSALGARGFMPLYHVGGQNHCPGCGGQQWIVGRMMAECGYCGSAIPMESFSTYSAAPRIARRNHMPEEQAPELRPVE
ncbi:MULTISPECIES: hypothetical protein [unclassified Sphingobium]|jgi:hypothetical protein|uniref:hypothetical protein n=1 Tax=unclassified Sphingobium TaxID=2611147 RepID=UPI000B8670F5|nr:MULTISPECIES: hypothetical protein [unclassified Sphingobium]